MTKPDALNLICTGLECLMDSERPSRDSLSTIECSLDADDCELVITFIEETDDETTGQVRKKRSCFLVTAEKHE